jgi:uncharacterized protein DUF4437
MKRFMVLFSVAIVGLLVVSVVSASAQKKTKKAVIAWSAEDIKWEAMKEAPPGVMTADLWGNMTKGAYGSFVKFPPNTKHPLHTHEYDIKTIVITGTFTYGPEGGEEKSYGPGSYIFIPGNVKHMSGSGPDGCTIFSEQSGKFDMKMSETKTK